MASAYRDWRQFSSSLQNPLQSQRKILEEIINVTSESVANSKKFQDIEPRDWEDLQPYVERAASGQNNVLSIEPVTRFEPTSGTTQGTKLIPSTLLQRQQFRRGIHAWVYDVYRQFPGLMAGASYWSISPKTETEFTSAGIPIGFEEDSEYLGRFGQWLVNQTLAVPESVGELREEAFQHATLLFLLAETDLRLVSIWSPLFLTSLMDYWQHNRDILERELYQGIRINGRYLKRRNFESGWPNLKLISCWTDGHARTQLGELRRYFPDVNIQPKGVLSTEALVSIPFSGKRPLAITSHYLEFETDDGQILAADQLREGDRLGVIVSTGNGMLRYRTRDTVEVTEFLDHTPCVLFVGRQNMVSDICGEKLSEAFVSEALLNLSITEFAVLVPKKRGYALYAIDPPNSTTLEAYLCRNFHYRQARKLGQLKSVQVIRLPSGAATRCLDVLESTGRRRGNVKLPVLDCNRELANVLSGLV